MNREPRPEERIRQVTPREITAVVGRHFPGASWVPLGRGVDMVAVLVAGRAVFRFPVRPLAAARLRRETAFLPLLRLPLAVPRPHWWGEDASGQPYLGYPPVVGRPAGGLRLSDAARVAAAPVLGAALRCLHEGPHAADLAALLPTDDRRRLDPSLRVPMARALARIAEDHGVVSASVVMRLVETTAAHVDASAETTVLHGDLYAAHLMVDDAGRPVGLIDWGDAHRGPRALDLEVMHHFLPPAAHDAFLQAYAPVSETVLQTARFRALYHGLMIYESAWRQGNEALQRHAAGALRVMSGLAHGWDG